MRTLAALFTSAVLLAAVPASAIRAPDPTPGFPGKAPYNHQLCRANPDHVRCPPRLDDGRRY